MIESCELGIKILQHCAVIQTVSGGQVINSLLQISCSVSLPKDYENRLTNVSVMSEDKVDPF